MTLAAVVALLSGAKASGTDQFLARCPVHDDHTQSLSVGIGSDGRVLLHCHAGCAIDGILSALGLAVSDLFPDQAVMPLQAPVRPRSRPAPETTVYDYTDASGTMLHQVVRGADKSFRQRHRNGTGAWVWKSSGIHVPYRLHDLMTTEATTVWVCEGEKDVDACWELGLSATTNLGGAGKWTQAETDALVQAGITTAFVIPDNDIPGRTHADRVIASLTKAKITATLVTLEGLEPHGDVTDWFADPAHTPEILLARAAAALTPTGTPTPDAVPAPDFLSSPATFTQVAEGHYSLDWPDLGVTLSCAYLRRERQRDLHGELVVRCSIAGARTIRGVLSSSNLNFSSQPARQKMATFLAGRSHAPELDWLGALEMFCFRTTDAEAAGSPIQPLADYDLPSAVDHWLVDDIPILKDHPMIIFGDGGSAKSMWALHVGIRLAQQGVRVLYADWEYSPESHRDRLGRLAGSNMPTENLHYVRCVAPLIGEQMRLEKHIRQEGIEYLICDSIAFAVPGRPEDAEHAAGYYRALRHLGVGSLNVAHTSKNVETGQNSPFGSVFWSNGARSLWHVKRSPGPSPTPTVLEIALTHKKTNLGALLPPRGIRFVFLDTETRVEALDLATSNLAGALPIWQRIRSAIALTPLSVKALAEELEEKPETIARTVRRMDLFQRDDTGLIRLAAGHNEAVL
jgi:hypothetical protein